MERQKKKKGKSPNERDHRCRWGGNVTLGNQSATVSLEAFFFLRFPFVRKFFKFSFSFAGKTTARHGRAGTVSAVIEKKGPPPSILLIILKIRTRVKFEFYYKEKNTAGRWSGTVALDDQGRQEEKAAWARVE